MIDDAPLEGYSRALLETVVDNSLAPDADLGQNFLVDWDVPRAEVAAADLESTDVVLEIGPGMGSLTCFLASAAERVIAIEKDDRFRPLLTTLAETYGNVELTYADALEYPLDRLEFDAVVANLPYGVALPLVFEVLEAEPDRAVLLLQADLAERITRQPGEQGYNRLSVQLYRRSTIELVERVEPAAFYPPPNVESAVVQITEVEPKFAVPSEEFFKAVLRYCFARRERTVGGALANLSGIDVGDPGSYLEGDLDGKRIETVTAHEFGGLTRTLFDRFGGDLEDAFERYYDKHGLYKRVRDE